MHCWKGHSIINSLSSFFTDEFSLRSFIFFIVSLLFQYLFFYLYLVHIKQLGSGSSPIQERSISSKEICGYNVIEVGGSLSSGTIHLVGIKSSCFSSFIFLIFGSLMCAKVQRIMHIMAAIEQKSASNSQILLNFCHRADKIEYICTRIPSCAVSKRHRGNEY